jgi:STE24 endopeptidase
MSDLLLERMTDDQIEAVFAHEMGHVVHRHLWWFVAYMVLFFGVAAGPLSWALDVLANHLPIAWRAMEGAESVGSLLQASLLFVVFFVPFTRFSQRLERQADVFAARVIQMNQPPPGAQALLPPRFSSTFVGEYGAGLFASALREVAVINRMPLNGRNWLHGSIQSRMNYLFHLSADPAHTTRFDRKMGRLFAVVLVTLCAFGVWGAVQSLQSARGEEPKPPVQQSIVAQSSQQS